MALPDDDPDDRETLRRQLALAVDTFREHGPLLLALDEAARHDHAVEAAYRAWFDLSVDVSAALCARRGAASTVATPRRWPSTPLRARSRR